jgi:prepilin-type processing-associated H-X9-DG protein
MDALTSVSEEIVFLPDLNLSPPPGEDILFIADEPAAGGRRARGRWRVAGWVAAAGVTGLVAWFMAVGIGDAVRAHRRARCADQLKRLGVAMHEYHETHGHFPAPARVGADGTPLLSWRVALLPFLGYRSLYERFHLDEPWDSPHNRALLAEMPPEFACPGGPGRRSGRTGYLVVVGPKNDAFSVSTPFEPARGVEIREITDGTSNTVLALETDAPVPWTKPEDLRWTKGGPLPRLASPHPGGAHVLLADGSFRFLKPTIAPEILVTLLTINGGEVIGDG